MTLNRYAERSGWGLAWGESGCSYFLNFSPSRVIKHILVYTEYDLLLIIKLNLKCGITKTEQIILQSNNWQQDACGSSSKHNVTVLFYFPFLFSMKIFQHFAFCLKIIIMSTGFTSQRKYMGSGLNYSQPNGITADKRELAFQAILSTLSRNEMGFCLRNIVVSKHKATLCSTANSTENSRQTKDQLQRWKGGQGGFFLLRK